LNILISKELATAINEQVGHELQASHQYVNIAAYFDGLALKKLAKMFFKQSEEEREYVMKFVHYVSETGGVLQFRPLPLPKPRLSLLKKPSSYPWIGKWKSPAESMTL